MSLGMTHHVIRSGLLALALTLSPLALAPLAAFAQEGDGVDINMDALKNRPTGIQPPPPPAPPAATSTTPDAAKSAKIKKFTGKSVMVLFEAGSTDLDKGAEKRLDE